MVKLIQKRKKTKKSLENEKVLKRNKIPKLNKIRDRYIPKYIYATHEQLLKKKKKKKLPPYCGIDKPKKGQKVGSMLECAQRHQLRRFGQYKVDSKILNMSFKKKDASRDKKILQIAMLRGKLRRLLSLIPYEKKKEVRAQMEEEVLNIRDQLTKIAKK